MVYPGVQGGRVVYRVVGYTRVVGWVYHGGYASLGMPPGYASRVCLPGLSLFLSLFYVIPGYSCYSGYSRF